MINEEHGKNDGRADNVENRDDRVTKSFVRTFRVRSFSAQDEDAGNCQDVKDERSRDDVVEQVAIKIPVTGYVTGGVGFYGAR